MVTEIVRGTKQNGRPCRDARREEIGRDLLGCRSRHVNAGQFERLALYRALYGHVMAGMRRYFVLRVDDINFLVGVVHAHVLGAMLLDALGAAFGRLVIGALDSALAV